LSNKVAAHGWNQAEARQLGERAAMSVTQSYKWGLALKADWFASHPDQRAEQKCRGDHTPQYWTFHPSGDSSRAFWRQPEIVWRAAKFLKPIRPMPRPLAFGGRQLKAMGAAIAHRDSVAVERLATEIMRKVGFEGDVGYADTDLSSNRRGH